MILRKNIDYKIILNKIQRITEALKLAKTLDVNVDFLVNGFNTKAESSIQQKSPFPIKVLRHSLFILTELCNT